MDWDDSIDPTVEAASRAEANDHSIDCNVMFESEIINK